MSHAYQTSDTGIADVLVRRGFEERERAAAAAIYDDAFGSKFALAIPSDKRRREYLATSFLPEFSFTAFCDGRLVGLAGVQSADGSLTGGITYRSLIAHLGSVRGHRAAAVFSLYERKPEAGELVMDGIAVDREMRGRGIGSRLLVSILEYARGQEFDRVRLDVIDTNSRARALYEKHGFVATRTEQFEWLRWLLGFGAATTMTCWLRGSKA